MITIIGQYPKLNKQITCGICASIMTYLPIDVVKQDYTDEGTRVKGITCPKCGTFLSTNP